MNLKSPKAKKKPTSVARLKMWSEFLRAPLLLLFILGNTSGDDYEMDVPNSNLTISHKHRHSGVTSTEKEILSDIKFLRRHLNKEIVNFVMSDTLMDGEVENRLHYNGITAKETSVGAEGRGLKLRQLTDGRHLVQVIYNQDGVIQDCEYITQSKSARNFLKTLRKELKLALDEENYRIMRKNERKNEDGDEKFYRHFRNVTFRLFRSKEELPPDVSFWLNYEGLKHECLKRHEELKMVVERKNKAGEVSFSRFRACLKLADTSVSNMVGKLFFNVVQTKCFVLKPVKMCTQRSWWGKCLQRGYMKQAFLRDNLPY